MSTPIIQTKLFRPTTRRGQITREHLLNRLDEGLRTGKRLTLISAPAGYGKTSLVAGWGARLDQHQSSGMKWRLAWLSLDSDDNDPARFFAYMVSALQQADNALGSALQPLMGAAQMPVEQLIPRLVNILARSASRQVLILDDYHVIDNRQIHDHLASLLEYMPQNMHLVLAARRDPPLPLGRMRARGELLEINVRDLRFDLAETRQFLGESMDVDLPPEDVGTLSERTEGWIAGLQLAALSLQNLDQLNDRRRFVYEFGGSHRHVVDYLLDEALTQQPQGTQDFLMKTAILPRMCADLCNAVTGRDDGQIQLESLDNGNFFIIALDYERRWYRFHHLFATLLRQRLRQRYPNQLRLLYAQAVDWLEANELHVDAIDVALDGGLPERAVQLLVRISETSVWEQGEYVRLAQWIDRLPESALANHPQLCVYYAWGLIVDVNRSDVAAAARWLTLAEKHSNENSDEHRHIRGQIAAIRASRMRVTAQIDETIALASFALDNLQAGAAFWQSLSHFNLAAIHYLGDEIEVTERSLAASETTARQAGDTMMVIAAMNMRGQLQVRLGRLAEAAHLFEQAMATEQGNGIDSPVYFTSGMSPLGLGSIHLEWNRLESASDLLAQGREIGRQTHHPLAQASSALASAQWSISAGERVDALKQMERASQIIELTGINWTWLTGPTAPELARLWLRLGELERARRVFSQAGPGQILRGTRSGFWDGCWGVVQTRILLANGSTGEALAQLRELDAASTETGRNGSRVGISLLLSQCLHALGQQAEAVAALADAVQLAEPSGYIRTFVDEGPLVGALLKRLPPATYRDRLLGAFGLSTAAVDQTELVEPLTERELQILRLMAARLSNREIADELILATTTVKWYSRQIYGKLHVNNRRAAVERAQSLGFL